MCSDDLPSRHSYSSLAQMSTRGSLSATGVVDRPAFAGVAKSENSGVLTI